jgi:hypothetical protein
MVNDKANRNSDWERPQVEWNEKQLIARRQWLNCVSGHGTVC